MAEWLAGAVVAWGELVRNLSLARPTGMQSRS
jgi:hypothetical protein